MYECEYVYVDVKYKLGKLKINFTYPNSLMKLLSDNIIHIDIIKTVLLA